MESSKLVCILSTWLLFLEVEINLIHSYLFVLFVILMSSRTSEVTRNLKIESHCEQLTLTDLHIYPL